MTAREMIKAAYNKHIRIPLWIACRPDTDITWTEKAVLSAILHHKGKNQDCWPTQRTIGKELGLSRQSINVILQRLKASNLVRISRRHINSKRLTVYSPIFGPTTILSLWRDTFLHSLGITYDNLANYIENDHYQDNQIIVNFKAK